MENGFRLIQKFPPRISQSVSLRLTKEVLKEREELHVLVEGLNVQITVGLNKLEEIRQEEIVIQQREKEIETRISRTQLIWSSHFTFPWKARDDTPPLVVHRDQDGPTKSSSPG